MAETRETTTRLIREKQPRHQATARLTCYLSMARMVEAAPLSKQRSRDAKDDPYLAAALAAKDSCLLTYDKDLLDMGKPFGIRIVKPSVFLQSIAG